ncbi:aldose epimerase family protein [Weissella coleopterorum]|uniref:aldose epimerase family protein n=1 Tax=Weissella coleopterorum TaxID=2714949 RepID=UPI001FE83B34|nr:aldose epimerase family protein [Weissella coleopterorum]
MGASWQSFKTAAGQDLVLGFHDVDSYLNNNYFIGNAVGRVAGRIDGASFDLEGQHYQLDQNEGSNTLHGGEKSFSHRNWEIKEIDELHNRVVFATVLNESEDHFLGTMQATVTYTLSDNDEVSLEFNALSDQATLFNPTSHVYFNLGGLGSDANQMQLQIKADRYMELRKTDKIPTGKLLPVAGTAYDFNDVTTIGDAITRIPSDDFDKKFDDVFALNAHNNPNVVLSDPKSKRAVEMTTDRNAVVFFITNPEVDNYQDQAAFLAEHPYNGVALEAQTLSDSIHHPEFGDIVLPANQQQTYTTTYAFKNL